MTDRHGFLELILGPMYSGKTTLLVDLYHEHQEEDKKVLVINYSADRRYHDSMLSTHDKVMVPCKFVTKLSELYNEQNLLNDADVILINEGQFFADIYEFALNMVESHGKTLHICGLDGDFQRNKFGKLLDLIPYADDVVKLKSRCHVCSKSAAFSHRLSGEVEQVVIGSDNYIPLCRGCYIKMNKKT